MSWRRGHFSGSWEDEEDLEMGQISQAVRQQQPTGRLASVGTVWSELRSNQKQGYGGYRPCSGGGCGLECQAKGDRGKGGVQYDPSRRICWLSEKGELTSENIYVYWERP